MLYIRKGVNNTFVDKFNEEAAAMVKQLSAFFAVKTELKKRLPNLNARGLTKEKYLLLPGRIKAKVEEGAGAGENESFTMSEQNVGDGAITGGASGGIAGLLAGAGAMLIPGVGPIIAGPLAAFLTGIARRRPCWRPGRLWHSGRKRPSL